MKPESERLGFASKLAKCRCLQEVAIDHDAEPTANGGFNRDAIRPASERKGFASRIAETMGRTPEAKLSGTRQFSRKLVTPEAIDPREVALKLGLDYDELTPAQRQRLTAAPFVMDGANSARHRVLHGDRPRIMRLHATPAFPKVI